MAKNIAFQRSSRSIQSRPLQLAVSKRIDCSQLPNLGTVSLGDSVSIRSGVKIDGNVIIKRATYLNGPAELRAGSGRIEIGEFCSFAGGLTMVCTNHPTSYPSTYHTRAGKFSEVFRDVEGDSSPIYVGSDVWVGKNSTVLQGVAIGDGAIIAANAVVTKNVVPYRVVGGVPARLIRPRFAQHIIEWLHQIQWWNWTDDQLRSQKFFFETKLDGQSIDKLRELDSKLL